MKRPIRPTRATPFPAAATRSPRAPARGARTLALLALTVTLMLLALRPAAAQQWVVDDATLTDLRTCQVEAWHGEVASWILPACQPFRNVEIALGSGFVDHGHGDRDVEYAVEVKTLFRALAPNDWGIGLVAGVGPNPSARGDEATFGDLYAFVPASLSLADDRLILHGNLGWHWERGGHHHGGEFHAEAHHDLTWGARADVAMSERFTAIGEVFGENRLLPEFQVGLRTHFPDAGMEVDLSWGGHTQGDLRGAGFTVGITLASGPIF
jgi:hypothetical protein